MSGYKHVGPFQWCQLNASFALISANSLSVFFALQIAFGSRSASTSEQFCKFTFAKNPHYLILSTAVPFEGYVYLRNFSTCFFSSKTRVTYFLLEGLQTMMPFHSFWNWGLTPQFRINPFVPWATANPRVYPARRHTPSLHSTSRGHLQRVGFHVLSTGKHATFFPIPHVP